MVDEPNTIPVQNAKPVATQPTTVTPTATPATATIDEPKQSIFKKWWLWAIVGAVVIIAAYLIFF